jgi:glycosyltransferase involved in cell wall biosynthesis
VLPAILVAVPDYLSRSSVGETVDDLCGQIRNLGFAAPTYSFDDLRPADRTSTTLSQPRRQLAFLRFLSRRLAACNILHIVFLPGISFVRLILPAVVLARFFGKRVIVDYRSPLLLNRFAVWGIFLKTFWRLCDRVLVPSAFHGQLIRSLGGRSEYIRLSLNLSTISPRQIGRLQPRVVLAADLEEENNTICAIRAYKLVKQKYPRAEMTIVGTGSQLAVLERTVEKERIPGVTFAGSVTREQRREAIGNSEVYVNCSSMDYLPMAVVEAFAFGLPVLTTPVSAETGAVRDGDNALLYKYGDHVGLAERIIALIEDQGLAERLARSARRTAENYSWPSVRNEWGLLYRDLIETCK